jgi:hypothetical protein
MVQPISACYGIKLPDESFQASRAVVLLKLH